MSTILETPNAIVTEIHARALLVWLTISTWSARKYDRRVSQSVNQQFHVHSDAGRYNKYLLPVDAGSYKTLIALASAIRVEHYTHTLAWSDEGWRLLPSEEINALPVAADRETFVLRF